MVIESVSLMKFLAPAERHEWFDLFISPWIALRWSAKRWLTLGSINIWLRLSRSNVYLTAARHVLDP